MSDSSRNLETVTKRKTRLTTNKLESMEKGPQLEDKECSSPSRKGPYSKYGATTN